MLKAHVKNGRLVLDEPTDRPEGEEVVLVPLDEVLARGDDYLDDEDRAALQQAIDEGVEDYEKGDTEDAFEFLARLKESREDNASPSGSPAASTAGPPRSTLRG